MSPLQKSSAILRWLGLAGLLIATFAAGVYGRGWLGLDRSSASSSDADHDAPKHDDHGHEHGGHDHAGHDHEHAGHDEANSIELSEQAKKNIGLELTTVELKPFERTINVPGIVVERPGQSTVEVTAPLTGIVTRIYPIQGQAIDPGQPLFELRLTHEELVQAQSSFLSTAEELDVIRKEVTRLKKIASDGIAGKTLLEREYEQQKKEAALRAQGEALLLHGLTDTQVQSILENRKLLRTLTVYAPAGDEGEQESDEETARPTLYQVQDLTVEQGQHVEAGYTLCSLVDHAQLYIEGRAFEQDADEINRAAAQGWKVTALSESDAEQHLDGLGILYVSGKVDLESRALHFYVVLPNQMLQQTESAGRKFIYWRFKPGQRMQIRVPVETWADRIVLPVEAVAQDGVESYVFEPNGDHFDRKPVHVEHRDQLFAVIENDGSLFPGDTVARSGAQQLQLALKNKSGGAIDPHAGHNH